MTKTLADMTAEERADCVGMWCDIHPDPTNTGIWIIIKLFDSGKVRLVNPVHDDNAAINHLHVTPRHDLPRAWTPEGKPAPLVREYGNGGWEDELNEPYHWPMRSDSCNEYCSPFDKAPAEYSRWVSKWEPIKPEPLRVNGMVNPHV